MELQNSVLIITIGLVAALGYIYGFWLSQTPKLKMSKFSPESKKESQVLFVNYYKIPVQIRLGDRSFIELTPGKKVHKSLEEVKKFFGEGENILDIYMRSGKESPYNGYDLLLNSTRMKVLDGTYKGVFVGQNSGHEDLGLIADPIRSTLGTAIPRMSIYNDTRIKLKFQIASDQICLEPGESRMYFGEEDHGIHLGTRIQNIDGILRDYVVDIPMTDIHLGLVLNHPTLLYTGAKIGGEFNDSIRIKTHLLELWDMDGPHRGMFSDKTFIL